MKRKQYTFIICLIALFVTFSCSKIEYESGGTVSTVVGLSTIKALHNGDDVQLVKDKLNGAFEISGVVISDKDNGNFAANEIIVQNTHKGKTAGLIFSFTDVNTNISLGDSVKVNIDNTILTRKNGALKIQGSSFTFDKVTKLGSNNFVVPTVVNLTTLYSNFYTYESTLVQINGMGFDNLSNGQIFNGDVKFATESASDIILHTLSTASFASNSLPLLADFVGIPTYFNPNSDYYNRANTLFKIRNEDDVFNVTGAPYVNFPETFEGARATEKDNYLMPEIDNTILFNSGPWKLYESIIGNQPSYDRYNPLNGTQSVRMKDKLSGSAYLEMAFDLHQGASKVEVMHAIYGLYTLNPQVGAAWDLEFSQDEGQTWSKIGETVAETNTKNPTIVTFNVNIVGKVRFRINKLGYDGYIGGQTGMLNIDDFIVYQNVD